jgi:hypothetical protein
MRWRFAVMQHWPRAAVRTNCARRPERRLRYLCRWPTALAAGGPAARRTPPRPTRRPRPRPAIRGINARTDVHQGVPRRRLVTHVDSPPSATHRRPPARATHPRSARCRQSGLLLFWRVFRRHPVPLPSGAGDQPFTFPRREGQACVHAPEAESGAATSRRRLAGAGVVTCITPRPCRARVDPIRIHVQIAERCR